MTNLLKSLAPIDIVSDNLYYVNFGIHNIERVK